MASKDKEARMEQKRYWEAKLRQHLGKLAEGGVDNAASAKDATVRKIRAKMRETQARLDSVRAMETKAEEMARKKAEKLAAPKEDKGKKKKKVEEDTKALSKRQEKKKKKKQASAQEAG